jgi:hypothetical protein
MSSLINFLKNLFLKTPQEILAALLRIILLLALFLIVIFLRFWECLLELLRKKSLYQEEKKKPCGRLPEAIIRRSDPCIYSQKLLQSQGLPVTWNNPDIWVARADNPSNIEPDSYHLVEDTDYIVSVRIHNASTDAAIGVRVRLNYRPWSFNSPDLTPVETDASGNEVFRFADIMPMSSAITTFKWRTPKLQPGEQNKHFCLQASLYHPMDINTANNMGQENTNVYSANPGHVVSGEVLKFSVPLYNRSKNARRFKFEAFIYEVNREDRFTLELKTIRGYVKHTLAQRLANIMPTLHVKQDISRQRFSFLSQQLLKIVKTQYIGYEKIKETILRRDYSLPSGMLITAGGKEISKGMEIKAGGISDVPFTVKIPDDAKPGAILPLNITAFSEDGVLEGGITLLLNVKEVH